jgi:hypothetical protein
LEAALQKMTESETEWEKRFQQLVEYKSTHGHCNNVPLEYSRHPHLGEWLREQRASSINRTLNNERKDRLTRIGVLWNEYDTNWELRFQQLLEYKEIKGHCNVPQKFSPNPQLGHWVMHQRQTRKILHKERKDKLDSIGFVFGKIYVDWDFRFEQLVQYKRTHGNCDVRGNYELNQELGRWVVHQRYLEGKNLLRKDRLAKYRLGLSV